MSDLESTPLSGQDRAALREAVRNLECPSFAMRVADAIGTPIERLLDRLPAKSRDLVYHAAQRAIGQCLKMALSTLGDPRARIPADKLHRAACTVSGALGGAFGLSSLAVELPVSTAIMLRSIADIARSEGEDLIDPEARLSCVMVFALGGRRKADDSAEIGYYAVRMALAQGIREAAAAMAGRGLAERQAPAILRVVTQIAERFGVTVSEKAVAQAAPVIGAVGGAAVNSAFIEHYQRVAHGHFTVRRLERRYGPDAVREEYERERRGMEC
jgi:EcsC family protein